MIKLMTIYGCIALSSAPAAEEQKSTSLNEEMAIAQPKVQTLKVMRDDLNHALTTLYLKAEDFQIANQEGSSTTNIEEPRALQIDDIVFVEEEVEVGLGFNTADYLPEGFNPYERYVDLGSIDYFTEDASMELGFDTTAYLPEHFDPYASTSALSAINYVTEDDVDLGFDTADYLPSDFNPYEAYFNVNELEYVDMEELEWELELNIAPNKAPKASLTTNTLAIGAINYIEQEDTTLGFDAAKYLPSDFDPYTRSK
ncbi:MAG: hypothetical protein AAGF77_14385 [Bacteroidota bacterium]